MLRAGLACIALLFTADLNAATIFSFASGFSDLTPGFWGIEFVAGSPDERIASATMQLSDIASFDFDGDDNYANQTAPVFDPVSSSGLNAGDVSFSFFGQHPGVLTIQFAAGAFGPGDRIQFAADVDGLGSKLGGAMGAYQGVRVDILLTDGRAGSGTLTTDTSVSSTATIEITPAAVPEPSALSLVMLGAGVLCVSARKVLPL